MSKLREYSYNELVDDFINDSEILADGLLGSYNKLCRKIALSNFVKGIYSGIGSFIGAVL